MSTHRDGGRAGGLSLSLLVILTWSAPALSRPGSEALRADVDDYFRQGKSLVRDGKLEEAYEAYLAGFQLRQSYDLAGNLGNVELELGKPRDAAAHLAFCIKNFPATGTAQQLEFIEGRLAEARRQLGTLLITVNVNGAEIFVDGRSSGRSPLLEEVFVQPGSTAVEARLHGYEPARQVLELGRGDSAEVTLSLLSPAPSVASPHPPSVPGASQPPSSQLAGVRVQARPAAQKNPVVLSAGLSGIAVGVGVGIAAMVVSNQGAASAAAERAALARSGGLDACSGSANQQRCDELDSAYLTRGSFRTVSIAGFAAAGVVSVATLLYALLPAEAPMQSGRAAREKAASKLRVQLLAAPGGAGLGVAGRF